MFPTGLGTYLKVLLTLNECRKFSYDDLHKRKWNAEKKKITWNLLDFFCAMEKTIVLLNFCLRRQQIGSIGPHNSNKELEETQYSLVFATSWSSWNLKEKFFLKRKKAFEVKAPFPLVCEWFCLWWQEKNGKNEIFTKDVEHGKARHGGFWLKMFLLC